MVVSQKIVTKKTPPRQLMTVSASLASGALSEVCDVTAVMRELDDKESDLVKEFVSRGCSCDFGPRKTPCSMLFPLEHYQYGIPRWTKIPSKIKYIQM